MGREGKERREEGGRREMGGYHNFQVNGPVIAERR